jgi:uncharacterized membrane protein
MKFHRVLKISHFAGLVIFLGSIFTFIVVSTLTQGASLENIAFARVIISKGTNALTLPGMWLLAVTGIFLGYKRYGLNNRFFQLKMLFIVLIILNAHFLIVPAADSASEIASRSVQAGQLLAEYSAAYMRETIFGAANILLAIAAGVVGVWRIGGAKAL